VEAKFGPDVVSTIAGRGKAKHAAHPFGPHHRGHGGAHRTLGVVEVNNLANYFFGGTSTPENTSPDRAVVVP
jgi:hypothetical protein